MWPDPSTVNPERLSTVNGIDFTLFLAVVLVVVGWLGDHEKLVRCLRAVEDRADHWTKRCIEAQAEVERLCASVAAEVEARLDAEVEVRLEAAEQAQSAHDRVEALAQAVRRRLDADGLTLADGHATKAAAEVEAVHSLLDRLGVPRRDYPLAGRVRHALELECMLRAQVERDNRALREMLEATRPILTNDPSKGPNSWSPDAVTLNGVEAVEGGEVLP